MHNHIALPGMLGLFCLTLLSSSALAQREANFWYFGENAGLRFDMGPVADTCGQLSSQEGCTTFSDAKTGRLLFYTEGTNVWDASHNMMLNGTGLMGSFNTVQSSIVVPDPGNDSLFYLFTKDMWNGPLGYSVINMHGNGGLGEVMTKNTILQQSNLTESMAATRHANGKDVWVVLHGCQGGMAGNMDTSWSAFLVTANGVDPVPVKTEYGLGWGYGTWCGACNVTQLTFSQDGKLLCYPTAGGVVHFDNATGKVTGLAAWIDYAYGDAISPDGTKIYVSTVHGAAWDSVAIWQYDMTAGGGNPDSIYYSSQLIYAGPGYGGNSMQLGPDGKIYHARLVEDYLGVINDPNQPGTACNYVHNGVHLKGKKSRIGLPGFMTPVPQFMGAGFASTASFLGPDSVICDTATMTLSAVFPSASCHWSNGETGETITVDTAGVYWVEVTYATGCGGYRDSILITEKPCSDTDTTVIITPPVIVPKPEPPCDGIFVPSAFSPNGDAQNDMLWVRSDCVVSMNIIIWDRWGEKVFQTDQLTEGWNGTFLGEEMSPGIFAFELNAEMNNGDHVYKKGNIALIK